MQQEIKGRVWLFGDNIDTDQMAPGQSMSLTWEERKGMVFPNYRDFAEGIEKGDLIVAGKNFGCGSSREQAIENLLNLGVSCVIAESFARIFMRNAIANALPVISCAGVSEAFSNNDEAVFSWEDFSVSNAANDTRLQAKPYNQEMLNIVQQGGMIKMLQMQSAAQQ